MDIEARVLRKLRFRIVYFVFILYMLFALDRVNISFAALQMNQHLGFDAKTYGLGVSLFYVSYLVLQLPSALLIRRFGIRIWLGASLVLWGLPSAALAFTSSKEMFFVLRFILGAAEAGFGTAIVYYLNNWFPKRYRGGAISSTFLAAPVSVVLGAPLSGWFLSFSGGGLAGWQWMFLLEGLPTVLLGVIALFYVSDSPAQAHWLSEPERHWLSTEIEREHSSVRSAGGITSVKEVLMSGRVWAAAGSLFSLILGFTGMLYWLPLVLKQVSRQTDFGVSLLSAIPWVAMGIGMYLNARHSDRRQERLWHVGGGMLAAALGLAVGASAPAPYNMLGLLIAGCGIGAAQGIFWTIPLGFLSGTGVAAGVAIINLVGNSAGLIGPNVIGWLRQATGSFVQPTLFLSASMGVGFLLLFPLRNIVKTSVVPEAGH
ncbi:MFS transporter [Paraburkholderia fungorum]|uniref:MFS transporter n=1 Tax=Paraburkholderia fungorum TaxID=134537 RepID=UPI0020923C6F|nr:MFS transporter [Paraburkholderia fungorum]USU18906.1 MFS transporter [Paraburkholderia fungorum]USU29098.1 MFS transporter [Paraburkholderia fungorum]